ncbi:hypothetical protein Bbelb_133120 [Branchiostoma belcheri]|nr:hypothetical protein Bbelb_133120 [Branchiostoma belcheri]
MKEALWGEKAQQVGKTADYLRGWWRSLKDMFTRLDRKKSGEEAKDRTEREEWIMKSCAFLRPLIRHKPQPLKSIRGDDTVAEKETESAQGKKRKQDDPTLQTLQDNLIQSGHLLKQLAEPAPLPSRRGNFANFVKDSLLTMSKAKYKVVKPAIWDILRKVDMEDDSSSTDDGDEPAPPLLSLASTATNPARPSSVPPKMTPSGQYQAPPSSLWWSATPHYMEQYRQAPLQRQYQQPLKQQPLQEELEQFQLPAVSDN